MSPALTGRLFTTSATWEAQGWRLPPTIWISSCVIEKPLLSPWDYLVPLSDMFSQNFLLLNFVDMHTVSIRILHVSLFAKSYPILCDPVDCSMPEFSLSLRFPGKSTEVVAICFKGMTLTPGLNPRLLLQWRILHHGTTWGAGDNVQLCRSPWCGPCTSTLPMEKQDISRTPEAREGYVLVTVPFLSFRG